MRRRDRFIRSYYAVLVQFLRQLIVHRASSTECMNRGWCTHNSPKSLEAIVHALVLVIILIIAFGCLATNYKFMNMIIILEMYRIHENVLKVYGCHCSESKKKKTIA